MTAPFKRNRLTSSPGPRQYRLTAFSIFGLAFLAIAVLVTAGLWLRYDDIIRDGRRNAENLASILAGDLQLRVSSVEETLRELASFSRFIGGPDASGQEWMTLLRTVAAGQHGFEAFMVTDASGRTTFSSLPILMGESHANEAAFDALSKNPTTDALIADVPRRSSNDSRIVVPLARVIRTPNSEFEGLAIANFAPEQLRDFYRSVDIGEHGVLWLLKAPDGILLREPPGDEPEDRTWPASVAVEVEPGRSGVADGPIASGGAEYVTAYRSLAGTGLTAAVSLAKRDMLMTWWNELYATAALTLLIGLVLLVAASLLGRRGRGESRTGNAVAQ